MKTRFRLRLQLKWNRLLSWLKNPFASPEEVATFYVNLERLRRDAIEKLKYRLING